MRTKKLNKTQQLELMLATVTDTMLANDKMFKANKCDSMIAILSSELSKVFAPKQGGGTSTKVNDEGLVYCNYFETYFEPSEFNTKLSKPNKTTGERTEGYKANCITAEIILRKIKNLKAKVTKQVTEAFRAKYLTEEEFEAILNRLDEVAGTKYDTLEDIPTVADIVGLTGAMSTDIKPVRG